MISAYQSTRVGFLDGFRFLLAFWVFAAHYYTYIGGTKYLPLPAFLLESFNKPVYAVNGFMVITGFLMAYNYITRKQQEPYDQPLTHQKFWLRRFFRLYPVYLLAITVAFVLYVPIAKLNELNLIYFTGNNISQFGTVRSVTQPAITDFLSHVLMIHGLFSQYYASILGVTWSLSLEAQFYLFFPIIFQRWLSNSVRRKNKLMLNLLVFLVQCIGLDQNNTIGKILLFRRGHFLFTLSCSHAYHWIHCSVSHSCRFRPMQMANRRSGVSVVSFIICIDQLCAFPLCRKAFYSRWKKESGSVAG